MTKIKVEFYKEVRNEHGCDTYTEKVTFFHECRPNTPYIENVDAAFSEAVARGHNPIKNIRMTAID